MFIYYILQTASDINLSTSNGFYFIQIPNYKTFLAFYVQATDISLLHTLAILTAIQFNILFCYVYSWMV